MRKWVWKSACHVVRYPSLITNSTCADSRAESPENMDLPESMHIYWSPSMCKALKVGLNRWDTYHTKVVQSVRQHLAGGRGGGDRQAGQHFIRALEEGGFRRLRQVLFLASVVTPKTKYLEVSVEPTDSLGDHNSILISEMLSQSRSCQCFPFHFLLPEKYYFEAFFPDQEHKRAHVWAPYKGVGFISWGSSKTKVPSVCPLPTLHVLFLRQIS